MVLCLPFLFAAVEAGGKGDDAKEALQALQEFIGGWNGSGTSEKNRSEIWKEKANWGWRFKGKDVWLTVEMPDSRHIKSGEIRYLTDKTRYQMAAVDKAGKKLTFEGELKKGRLILERLDPDSKETQQIQMSTAGGGLRFIWNYAVKPENRTLYNKQYQVAFTKEGESFGSAAKKNECVVTGGLGTSTVSYMGVTYYVCCSGCRDAFNENPAKIVKEYLARKKAGK
jgi:hypothetical protein